MIGVCTDSNSQLPREWARDRGIEVVPISVSIDGVDHLEGIDLDADAFYACFEQGRSPEVTTAAPSPSRIADAYASLVERGVDEIVSVHVGSELSGTLNAARLAAAEAPVPVHLVDTGSASFVVACAALSAADVASEGGDGSTAVETARRVARACGNIFVVGTVELARAGGRLDPRVSDDQPGIPVLRLDGSRMVEAGSVRSPEEAAQVMAAEVLATDGPLRVGVGVSDSSSRAFGEALTRQLLERPERDVEVVPYRVGPSVGAHTGPGTAGAVYHRRLR